MVLLADIDGNAETAASRLAEEINLALREPQRVGELDIPMHASVGISVFPRDATDAETLLRHSDHSMYRAKRSGGSTYRVYQRGRVSDHAHSVVTLPDAPVDPGSSEDKAHALDAALRPGGIRSVYQPIVDLATRMPVAYEALARGPEGSSLERPDLLFAAARDAGRLAELDWACRISAVCGARDAGLSAARSLFVNVEPDALDASCPPELLDDWTSAGEHLQPVLEITERALTARPSDLLRAARDVRSRGWGLALDDVGADTRSLALMPLLRPDVIKLDLRLVQEQPGAEVAEIVNAVNAERERTNALILAEGIETERHLQKALAMGATLGQGWLFGRPGAIGDTAVPGLDLATSAPGADAPTPYTVVQAVRATRPGTKRLLLALSMQLEQQAMTLGSGAVVIGAFQASERFTRRTRRRYTALATDAALVAALGVGMETEPAPGVRGAALSGTDPLLGEWSVAVVGPHFSGALVALDRGDGGPEMERSFDFALTYDRDLVIAAANSLLTRVLGR
jgi:EAL domain-containing protein (putative c-di-GMP-specific phosphodiesterase class I)